MYVSIVCIRAGAREPPMALGFTNAVFGRASYSQPIHLDEVTCFGNETNLLDCDRNDIGVHNCRHSDDASVDCLGRSPGAGKRVGVRERKREREEYDDVRT